MKKAIVILICCFLGLACNREGPINVSGNGAAMIHIKAVKEKGNQIRYSLYLPADWLPAQDLDSLKPFIMFFHIGTRTLKPISRVEIQGAEAGWENYYRQDFLFDRDYAAQILLTFGNWFDDGLDMKTWSFADLKRDSPYVVNYQPTDDRADDIRLIGIVLYDGGWWPLDNNSLLPIKGKLEINPSSPKTNSAVQFSAREVAVNSIIGIKSVTFEFDDGFVRYGPNVFYSFDKSGKKTVTMNIIDNLQKKLSITKTFTVFN